MLSESFNTAGGNTLPAGWSRIAQQGSANWVVQNFPVLSSGSGSYYLQLTDPDAGAPNTVELRLPAISTQGRSNLKLSYYSRWDGIEGRVGRVQYSLDGGASWTNIRTTPYDNNKFPSPLPAGLTQEILPLPAAAENQASVLIRFWFTDNNNTGTMQWQLDDIVVYADNDIGIVDMLTPTRPACGFSYGAAEPIRLRLRNHSNESITLQNLPINVVISGPTSAVYTDVIFTTPTVIAPSTSVDVTLPTTANMQLDGTYTFIIEADLAGDGYLANNVFTRSETQVIVLADNSFHLEDFDGDQGGWQPRYPTATANVWQWGALPEGFSGYSDGLLDIDVSNGLAWYTDLTTTSADADYYLEGPIYDLRLLNSSVSSTDQLFVEFDYKLNIAGATRLRLQFSTDNGASWQNIETNNARPGFYRGAPSDATSNGTYGFGASGGVRRTRSAWQRAAVPLCGLRGNNCVRFRFWVVDDGGTLPLQFAVDNFRVSSREDEPDFAIGNIVFPPTSGANICELNSGTALRVQVYNNRCQTATNVPVVAELTRPGGGHPDPDRNGGQHPEHGLCGVRLYHRDGQHRGAGLWRCG